MVLLGYDALASDDSTAAAGFLAAMGLAAGFLAAMGLAAGFFLGIVTSSSSSEDNATGLAAGFLAADNQLFIVIIKNANLKTADSGQVTALDKQTKNMCSFDPNQIVRGTLSLLFWIYYYYYYYTQQEESRPAREKGHVTGKREQLHALTLKVHQKFSIAIYWTQVSVIMLKYVKQHP